MEKKRQIVVGVTGSIAAYKAAELVRRLRSHDCAVQVVMTDAAKKFVGELTFRTLSQNPVHTNMFDPVSEWRPQHISLAEWADALVIAPCTANVLAKLAHGIADDLLTCVGMASAGPLIVAPAMNERMWLHPATQENVALLKSRGVVVIDVGSGELACGYSGRGRMADLDLVIEAVAHATGGIGGR